MSADEQPERELVQAILDGHRQAFLGLIKRYERLVFRIVSQLIPNPHDHQDLYQDIFLKVYKNLDRFQFDSKLSTWIAKIAYTTCYKVSAKKRPYLWDDFVVPLVNQDEDEAPEYQMAGVEGEDLQADHALLTRETETILQQEIEVLPPLLRTLLTLFYREEMSHQEIARITDLPINTIKSHLHRTRKLLKNRLTKAFDRDE